MVVTSPGVSEMQEHVNSSPTVAAAAASGLSPPKQAGCYAAERAELSSVEAGPAQPRSQSCEHSSQHAGFSRMLCQPACATGSQAVAAFCSRLRLYVYITTGRQLITRAKLHASQPNVSATANACYAAAK
jgi:hypothetical protein